MVRAGTMVAPVDPHLIDVAIKTLALAASAALLYVFSTTLVARVGAVLAAVLYLFVTAAAFGSEGYAIYFTNDYLAILSWFAGVVALRRRQWWLAALAAFAGAWAKETALLIVFLAGFEALRKRAPWSAAIACGVAFAIPTLVLRTMYPAPIAQWAWWDTFKLNVPFIVWQGPVIAKALRDNLKVLLFLNVMWFWAWRAWRRTQDHFVVSLGLTLACYVVLAWMVVYIRELRHMLPFTILVIPLAVAELESALSDRRTAVERRRTVGEQLESGLPGGCFMRYRLARRRHLRVARRLDAQAQAPAAPASRLSAASESHRRHPRRGAAADR